MDKHKAILKGKFGPGVTARGEKEKREHIAQTINGSFSLCARGKLLYSYMQFFEPARWECPVETK